MAGGTGGSFGFPMAALMTLGARHPPMILIKPKAGHGIVGEPQVLPFPTVHAVAFGAVGA